VPTRCQNTPPAPCVTTPRRQRGWSRGTWLLPAIEHPPMPCATTSCRTSPPEGRLDGTLPATICWRRCSTASSGCDPGQRVLARVSKNRARRCLTPCRRRTYSSVVRGDHMPLHHGRDWCVTGGGRRAPLEGGLDSPASWKHGSADAGWWGVVEYKARPQAIKAPS